MLPFIQKQFEQHINQPCRPLRTNSGKFALAQAQAHSHCEYRIEIPKNGPTLLPLSKVPCQLEGIHNSLQVTSCVVPTTEDITCPLIFSARRV